MKNHIKIHFKLSFVIALVLSLSACSTSNSVVSGGIITKRKVNKGFFINKNVHYKTSSSKHKIILDNVEKDEFVTTDNFKDEEFTKENQATKSVIENQKLESNYSSDEVNDQLLDQDLSEKTEHKKTAKQFIADKVVTLEKNETASKKIDKKTLKKALDEQSGGGNGALRGIGWFLIILGLILLLLISILIGILIMLLGLLFVASGGKKNDTNKKDTNDSSQYIDVLYLKNGSVIRGVIIEQEPNVQIKIKTNDGSIFVYKMEEVEKITKEPKIK